jgi:hypothetical protein
MEAIFIQPGIWDVFVAVAAQLVKLLTANGIVMYVHYSCTVGSNVLIF